MKADRFSALDLIRGLAIISMVLYHAVWDVVNIFDSNLRWFKGDLGYLWQQSIGITFIFLAGFSFSLSSRKIKRGIFVSLCGGIITAVTLIFMPENRIIFGVLTFIGAAILLQRALEPLLKKVNSILGFTLSLVLFVVFKNLRDGLILTFPAPKFLYKNYFTAFLGFPPRSFWSNDYYGFFPWFFLFLCGYFAYNLFKEKGWLRVLTKIKCPPIEFIGRHSIMIYMVHQPLVYALLILFSWILRAI